MKKGIKTTIAALALSVITGGVALAMIPQADLTQNQFPDQGVSSQVLSDIDTGMLQLRKATSKPGLSELDNKPEPLTQLHQQLVGKHLI